MAKKRMNILWAQKYGDVNDPKTAWKNVGTLFIDEETGRPTSIKIDMMPANKDFDGWLAVLEPRQWDNSNQRTHDQGQEEGKKDLDIGDGPADEPINLDDIPF